METPKTSRTNIENIYPLSPMQQGMLFHTLLAAEPGMYFVQIGWTLRGALDTVAFLRAWNELVARHAILRTAFVWERLEAPTQMVLAKVKLPVEERDLRGMSAEDQRAALDAFLAEDRRRGFDLTKAPLMRLSLLRLADETYRLVWSRHHLLLDGWSTPILVKELFALYEAYSRGEEPKLARPRPFGEYIAWLQKQDLGAALAYFKERLGDRSSPTSLGVDHAARLGPERYEEERVALGEEETLALTALSRDLKLTPSTVLQAAWALVLSRSAGERDVVFGVTVSGRSAPVAGIDQMVGLFINTLPIRATIDNAAPASSLLAAIQGDLGRMKDYEHTPLLEAQGVSGVPRGTPLFESLVVFENYPIEESLRGGGGPIAVGEAKTIEGTNYPLTILASLRKTLDLRALYDVRRFERASVERLLSHLKNAIVEMVRGPSRALADVPIMDEAERRRVLVDFNRHAPEVPAPRAATAIDVFEEVAARQPDERAILFENRVITYGELDARANQLAHELIRLGVGPEVIVGISMDRAPEMIVSMLAAWKAGGAYVPLDPSYPRDRLELMIEDAGVRALLTEDRVLPKLPVPEGTPALVLDTGWPAIASHPNTRPDRSTDTRSLAYVIYTSGSTGKPKGVSIEHKGLASLAGFEGRTYALGPGVVVLQFSSINFDVSVWDIVGALLNGATLALARQDDLLPGPDLLRTIRRHQVNVMSLTPSALAATPYEELPSLRTIIVAGEACPEELVTRWQPGRRFHNAYGPTEITVIATETECFVGGGKPTIGKPIDNVEAYVLDEARNPVPIGVLGELYVGGIGVARGYLHRPELSAERFLPNPFRPGELMYKTGDLSRWLPDGTVDYLGRIDLQVKVRGYRIELGEIESVLLAHPDIAEATVIAREDTPGDKQLVAYFVPREEAPSASELRAHLRDKLPEYMIPGAFVELSAMPLSPAGKIDRRALPAPEGRITSEEPYVAPRDAIEEGVVAVFSEVLRVESGRIGIHDSFFELGGHSLRATQAVARLKGVFGVEVPLRALFESPTPAALAESVRTSIERDRGIVAPPLVRSKRDGYPPLSFAQERFWFVDQLEPGDPSYVVALTMRFEGALDVGALERTLIAVVERHEVLRTTYQKIEGKPAQVVGPAEMPLHVTRWPDLSLGEREAAARRAMSEEMVHPFDLARGPIARARLFELGTDDHVLFWTMHHIVADAWTNGLIKREIALIYSAFVKGEPAPIAELPVQYADYAAWQRGWLAGEVLDGHLAYWAGRLTGAPHTLDLPTDRPRPAMVSPRGEWRAVRVPDAITKALRDLSRRENATLFMVLLAAFDVLVYRYSNQADFLIGSPIAGRTRAELEGLAGCFVNTLVLRARLSPEMTFRELVAQVREECLGAYAHQDLPFERLVQKLDPTRDRSRSPLFQVMFSLQNTPRQDDAPAGLKRKSMAVENVWTKFDITFAMQEGPSGLTAVLEYKTDLFDRATIDRMLAHYVVLLESITKGPQRLCAELGILGAEERRRALVEWNDTGAPVPDRRSVHELFEDEAAKSPDAPAVIAGGETLSYGELDRRANKLASYLRALGVGPGALVAICVTRSIEMVVGIAGVLKAGGAYVPIDPTYPADRIAFVQEDTAAPVLLTQSALLDELPVQAPAVICLDSDWPMIEGFPDARPEPVGSADDLAYVIYTSGSTGKPKGVAVTRRNLLASTAARLRYYTQKVERFLVVSSFAFDSSVAGIFWTLAQGGAVVLPPDSFQDDPSLLVPIFAQHGVTHLLCVPSLYTFLLANAKEGDLASLRTVILAGEALPIELLRRHFKLSPGALLYNEYGPTEATVWCSVYAARGDEPGPRVPIGKPIANTKLYVLDARMQPVPVGVTGELYVGGAGITKGYWNRSELTDERFVPDPFSLGGSAKLYKTGDLVRLLPSGDIDFFGRTDHQVKIRGYRIELGEIEAALAQHHGVIEAVVAAREDSPGDKRLVGYVVPAEEPGPSSDELASFLGSRLPDYMVPRLFVKLAALPLSPNGKVDRAALPAPDGGGAEASYVAPRSPVEEAIAGIWADILDLPRVGAHDDFFALGGHSLLATQAMGRIASALGVEIPLAALFESPTVAGLAERVDAAIRAGHGVEAPALVPVDRKGELLLSFAQERLWFLAQLEPGDTSYNIPIVLRMEGELDVPALERALAAIVRRHEVLRTSFAQRDGHGVQIIHQDHPLPLVVEPLFAGPASETERVTAARRAVVEESKRPFDLAAGPPVRARLFGLGDDDHVLVLNMHHIVADAWSMGILNRELTTLYRAFAAGEDVSLPDLAVQYADYAAWQRSWLSGDVLERHLAHFRSALDGAKLALDLPADKPRPAIRTNLGQRIVFSLSPEVSKGLEAIAQREGATLYMVLLSAFDVLLHRYTEEEDILVGSPIAGRTRAETEGLIGFFLNMIVMRANVTGATRFTDLLRETKARSLAAYAHQDLPFERLVQEIAPERDMSRSPVFQVIFNLQNTPAEALTLPKLKLRGIGLEGMSVKVDLTLIMAKGKSGELMGWLNYSTDIFEAATAERMLAHLRALLEGIVAEPSRPIGELGILPDDERRRLVVENNHTATPWPKGERLDTMFANVADRSPALTALVAPALAGAGALARLSFGDLAQAANRYARHLRDAGVGPGSVVGLCLPRSAELVTGMLGILAAGGAYAPIDPSYPPQRIADLLTEAGSRVIVTTEAIAASLDALESKVQGLVAVRADADACAIAERSAEPLDPSGNEGDLAYVLFTSGSTGKPKGVAVEHRHAVNYLRGVSERMNLPPGSSYAHVSTFAADLGNTVLFPPLCLGGTLHLIAEELTTDPDAIGEYFTREGIDCLKIVPSHLSALLSGARPERALPKKLLVMGGEASTWELIARIERLAPDLAIMNHYGPTETTVGVLTFRVDRRRRLATPIVPLGRPLPNCHVYVLDKRMTPAPIGVPGELYIGGAQVARGYLGKPELTAERFVPDPFSTDPNAKLYKTGDRARVLADNNVLFLGRLDFQVKIRGYRVELGEIEAALASLAAVREAVVLVHEDARGDKRLVAHVVASGSGVTSSEIERALGERLPAYMVPASFVFLEAIPLTPNGKIDRRALEALGRGLEGDEYVAPRSPVEEVLASVWADVFERDKIGVHERFGDLGGHSLLAIQIVARTRDAFQCDLPLRALFEAPTIAALAERVEEALREGRRAPPPITRVPRDGDLPLSFGQERLWFLSRLEPDSPFYNVATSHRITGPLDTAAFTRAVREVVRRHEVLRTSFREVDGKPTLRIHDDAAIEVPVEDLRSMAPEARDEAVRREARFESRRPFDLSRAPLVRVRLLRVADDDHVVLLTLHHIVSDAVTRSVWNREVSILYRAFAAGRPSPLADLAVQYVDYAAWQRTWLRGDELDRQLGYWRERLADAPAAIDLPADRPRPALQTYNGRWRNFALGDARVKAIKDLSRRAGATSFMTTLAAFEVLLYRLTGQSDLVVGTPAVHRTRAETEGLIGLFMNMLVLRSEITGAMSFVEAIERVRDACLGAYAHQDLPFERLVQELTPVRDMSRAPLFQVLFAFQSAPPEAMALGGLSVRGMGGGTSTAKFDLTLGVIDTPRGMVGSFEYNTDLFDAETIDRMVEHFLMLLDAAAEAPDAPIADLSMLPGDERARVVTAFNAMAPALAPSSARVVRDLVHATIDRVPDDVAVSFEGKSLTYRELGARANKLARELRAHGVGPDKPVGIALDRSIDLVVGILAIFEAGGAYMALDPEYPPDRLAFMVEDAKAPVIITDRALAATLPAHRAHVLLVDDHAAAIDAHSADRLDAGDLGPEHLGYLIYTSGSTGKPKGVAMTQGPLVNLIRWQTTTRPEPKRTLQFASPNFDVCFQEIATTWASGGELVLVSSDVRRDAERLFTHIAHERVERLFLPPVALYQLAEVAAGAPDDAMPLHLGEVIAAGEALNVTPRVAAFFARLRGATLSNQYGPSETHVVTEHVLSGDPKDWPALPPIGRAISGVRAYVLDAAQRPVPIGVRGELYFGGAQVARGYLDKPELTAERFMADPFSDEPGARMYKTGDLARYKPDGSIDFLGRADTQVKIRGFRVELGEIEAVLASHPALASVVVMVREDGEGQGSSIKRIVAYVVPKAAPAPSAQEIRAFVKDRLPEYMVPAVVIALDEMPLTASGKVDRRALPARDPHADAAAPHMGPREPVEEVIAKIFAEVLMMGPGEVGAHDDFFELGGHSLIATQAVSRIHAALGADLPVRVIFEAPTVAELARRVEEALGAGDASAMPKLRATGREGTLPLSFAQERLWFITRLDPSNPSYALPVALRLRGALDKTALEKALSEVVARHEALRTRFTSTDGVPAQIIDDPAPVPLPLVQTSEDGARRAMAEETRRPFDLERGPLFRAALYAIGEGDHALLLVMHHIVADGFSLGVIAREISALYPAFAAGRPSPLDDLPIQYADYARWQRRWLTGDVEAKQLAYWKGALAGAPQTIDLPADRPRPAVMSSRGARRPFYLPEGLPEAITKLAHDEGATLFMTLLAAFGALLRRVSGQDDVLVGTPIAGRTQTEIEGLVGLFVNTLVLRADMRPRDGERAPSFRALLARTKEACLGAYAHQDLPFEALVHELAPSRDRSRSPLFQAMFMLQTAETTATGDGSGAWGQVQRSGMAIEGITTKFDLSLAMSEGSRGLMGSFEYATDLFDGSTIDRLVERFRALLTAIVKAPDAPIDTLPILSDDERTTVLTTWNATATSYPRDASIPAVFAAQVARAPDREALSRGGASMSYQGLDARSNKLARILQAKGVAHEEPVGLAAPHGFDMIVATLGILKAGGAYLPIDAAAPPARVRSLLADAGARFVIAIGDVSAEALAGVEVIRIDDALDAIDGGPVACPSGPESLAYVMYTSGSTGVPKGVCVEHRNVVRLVKGANFATLDEHRTFLQLASIAFDAATLEIWGPLLNGGRVAFAESEQPSIAEIGAAIKRHNVTSMWLTAGLFNAIIDTDPSALAPLSELLTGGEALSVSHVRKALAALPSTTLINGYGPTENTTFTACHRITSLADDATSVPIGKPIANSTAYILDAHREPVPIGVVGELYAGGDGVARGYLKRPDLTAERFLADPFIGRPNARMYKTGDLVRATNDGTLIFVGRADDQVKLRGFRVELGEIEAALAAHPGVGAVAVVLRTDGGEKRVVAYVVPRADAPSQAALRSFLAERLPSYMVPSVFVSLAALPLTPNGKVDRRALPAPVIEGVSAEDEAPRTDLERTIADVWAEVLKLPSVGVHRTFFELGGHSLKATQVIARIERRLGLRVPLAAIFDAPTVAELASVITAIQSAAAEPEGDGEREEGAI